MKRATGHERLAGRLAATAALLATIAVGVGVWAGAPEQPRTSARLAEVRAILAEVPLIDGHNDLAEQFRDRVGDRLDLIDLRSETGSLKDPMQTDIPRLRRGLVGGQFWSVYVPVSLQGPAAVQAVFEQIDLIHRMVQRYPDVFALARTADDVERIHRSGRIASLIGMEGGHSIGDSLAVLRQAYACGARYLTLTHWSDTDWADAATDGPRHHGLTRFGREVVREMNRLGMLVDLSHVSDETMRAAIATSEAPVIFSHSSARALCNHVRNVPDDILKLVAAKGGVVMVNFAPGFVDEGVRLWQEAAQAERTRLQASFPGDSQRVEKEVAAWRTSHPSPRATLAEVADHIDHIRAVAGIEHVGIGSDFDGIGSTPLGLEDVSRYPDLLAELLRRGYTAQDVKHVAGLNILRVMREAERVANRLQKQRRPSDALIEDLDPPPAPPEHGSTAPPGR